jgi:uncharacterized protein (TIGR03435 family)
MQDRMSLRKTVLIQAPQHPPPTNELCQSTAYGFAPDIRPCIRSVAIIVTVLTTVVISGPTTLIGRQAAFEVVSIRPAVQDGGFQAYFVRVRGGRFEARTNLRLLIQYAYEQDTYARIATDGNVSKLLEELFEIQAKLPGDSELPIATIKAMTREMLAERFKLKLQLTTERRTTSVLRRVKPDTLGPNLRPFNAPCIEGSIQLRMTDPAVLESVEAKTSCILRAYNGHVRGTTESMVDLARHLTTMIQTATWSLDEHILDDTGLVGRHQVEMDFDPRTRTVSAVPSGDLPSFNDALQRQLGLKVEKATRTMPLVVVQYAEMPAEN